ncbi:Detected protein of unknown function [Hibiscus syriacus]|uniref:Ubiquitin-like domain-containing protein n=2 Tax=Hibiscus syriacus TaxID=106335 RepID=A0A6A2Z936_HIBSY|nr:Detected protein of unknown function [Hibiscus syriacus]
MKTEALKVKSNETVKNLKVLLHEKGMVSSNIQGVFFSGNLLKDDERLVDMKRTLVVEARAHDTVRSIKSLIVAKEGIEFDRFSLDVVSIYVKALTGEVAKLKVKVTFSVADVKAIAESILGASAGSLSYLGQQLEDSKILACYDIKEVSMLEILLPLFQIFVKSLSGRRTLDVRSSTTVDDVEDNIYKKLKLPVDPHFNILFSGKRLIGGRSLASYGIQKDFTLYALAPLLMTVKHMKVRDTGCHISHSTTVHAVKETIFR